MPAISPPPPTSIVAFTSSIGLANNGGRVWVGTVTVCRRAHHKGSTDAIPPPTLTAVSYCNMAVSKHLLAFLDPERPIV
ncbi:hypothetical protein M422DRAFT_251984 [Sphaerobolus stellatus SS14]|uniref:Uncharacterized protein n=1 Tax=Sphaerobolus stellatus (strain SS14) TaxID=990650 RepID=A0A0C9VQR5_SPHS4|nr:hypothetical protein M422DRAFT_251984 [Sphaerobolus stellatus SS14]